jgi:hypothetical protein
MIFTTRPTLSALVLAAALGLGGMALFAPEVEATAASDQVMKLDVVMDGTSFFFEGDVDAQGFPARGTPFVIEGYVYPGGTLDIHGDLSGVLPDGSPEFPELVLGHWTCSGWHLLDGSATSGVVVVTRQTFDFDLEHPGRDMVVTEGIELADEGVPFERVIVGGSGRFNGLGGQMTQVMVGGDFNPSGGFNTTYTLAGPHLR